MGTIKIPQAVQYFASIIFKEKNHLVDAKDNILQLVGPFYKKYAVTH